MIYSNSKCLENSCKSSISMTRGSSSPDYFHQSFHAPAHRNRIYARVFQAFRIAVNQELDKLKTFLNNFIDCLTVGGRIVIISYHSLEDRLVKHAFKNLSLNNRLSVHTKKPLTPSEDECFVNRRSKSAKLRSAERIL